MKMAGLFLTATLVSRCKGQLPALSPVMLSVLVAQLVGSFRGFRQEEGIGKEKEDEMFFSFSQWFASFLDSIHSPSLSHSQCEFLSGSLTFCLSLPPSYPLPLVNTHYGQQTQWQFSPSAIWDQYWVSSTTSWPDILISVIQTKYYAFCPPTRQPTVYSPSEWLKSNVDCKHTFMDDYL